MDWINDGLGRRVGGLVKETRDEERRKNKKVTNSI